MKLTKQQRSNLIDEFVVISRAMPLMIRSGASSSWRLLGHLLTVPEELINLLLNDLRTIHLRPEVLQRLEDKHPPVQELGDPKEIFRHFYALVSLVPKQKRQLILMATPEIQTLMEGDASSLSLHLHTASQKARREAERERIYGAADEQVVITLDRFFGGKNVQPLLPMPLNTPVSLEDLMKVLKLKGKRASNWRTLAYRNGGSSFDESFVYRGQTYKLRLA